jgi:predicted Zn-dependent protease
MTIGDHKVGASDCVIRFRSFGLWRRRVGALLCAALSSVALTAAEPTDEIKAGREITAIYLGAAPLLEDASAQRYVNLVGRHLADQSSRPALPWTFGILATESVNAFSAPGGFVLLTQGLMDLLETEDELAAILAHEIAHVVREHHWAIIQKQQQAAELIARMQGNMKSQNALFSEMNALFSDMMTRGLDKEAEFEADRDAVIISANGGYDSSAMLSVLEKLDALKADSAETQLLFQTHPSPMQRLDRLTLAITPEVEGAAAATSIPLYRGEP